MSPLRQACRLFVEVATQAKLLDITRANSSGKKIRKASCTIQCTVIRCLQTFYTRPLRSPVTVAHSPASVQREHLHAALASWDPRPTAKLRVLNLIHLNSHAHLNLAQKACASWRPTRVFVCITQGCPYAVLLGSTVASAPHVLPRPRGHRAAGDPIYFGGHATHARLPKQADIVNARIFVQ
jgi:hypothetical protein